MSGAITDLEFQQLRDYIEKHCGISLDRNKVYLVESRLTTLMVENGCETYAALYRKASSDPGNTLRDKIIDAMTTNETLWFRDSGPYETLRELLAVSAGEIKSGKRSKIRIWSAACSSGQEPYSIAISVLESGMAGSGLRPEHVEILGTDISSTALFMAKLGRYDAIAINRGLSPALRDRYFKQDGRVWALSDNVKRMVTLKKMNLQESFVPIGKCDLIFCRNVLIYFSEQFKRDIFSKIAGLLRPSGILFVGASESVSTYSNDYSMVKNSHGIYYKVK
jgi:chemotaxis protein methyltransferase CheR